MNFWSELTCDGANWLSMLINEYSLILLEFSARFMREKKKNMHFGSLIMIFESLMDITKKVLSLGSLIGFNGINYLFGVKNFNGLVNKCGKCEECLTQKPYLSDQVTAIYAILNQDISLLASNLYYLLNLECIKCIYQINLVFSLLFWIKLYISKPLTRISNLYQKRPQPLSHLSPSRHFPL